MSGAVQPAGVFQLQPQLYAAVQPHAAQEAVGQADLSVAVSAQRALQGEQPGRGEEKRGSAVAR